MKRKGFLQTAFTLTAALLLLAGCTQNELADKQGEPLPEGKYPLTFTAAIDGETVAATPQTRASADGTFKDDDYIGVAIPTDGSLMTYRYMTFKKNGAGTTTWEYDRKISGDAEKPYWQSATTGNAFTVKAWYVNQNNDGQYYKASSQPPFEFWWEVAEDQSGDGYANSDFLYAFDYIWFPTKEGNKILHFFHQTAKVVVHVIKGDQTPADITGVESMTIGDTNSKFCVTGLWYPPTDSWSYFGSRILGQWTPSYGDKYTKSITPQKFDAKEGDVSLKDGEELLASYEALVIPQEIDEGKNLFVINIEGYDTFYYKLPDGGITWQSGTEYTYYITIKGSSLSVTTSESIGWSTKDAASGSGSVEIE